MRHVHAASCMWERCDFVPATCPCSVPLYSVYSTQFCRCHVSLRRHVPAVCLIVFTRATFSFFCGKKFPSVTSTVSSRGGYFQENWVGVCGTLPETFTLFYIIGNRQLFWLPVFSRLFNVGSNWPFITLPQSPSGSFKETCSQLRQLLILVCRQGFYLAIFASNSWCKWRGCRKTMVLIVSPISSAWD